MLSTGNIDKYYGCVDFSLLRFSFILNRFDLHYSLVKMNNATDVSKIKVFTKVNL